MNNNIIKSAYGVTVSKSYIHQRPLEIVERLCWRPEDVGLTLVHSVDGALFDGAKEAARHAKSIGVPQSTIKKYFRWVNEVAEHDGIERDDYLKQVYWPSFEQTANILFDTIIHAYIDELAAPLSATFNTDIGPLEFVELRTTNAIRKYSGQPDSVLIDHKHCKIVFIEMKLKGKTTKYSLDQHIKYLTLNALIGQQELLPGYQTYNLFLAPRATFEANTDKLDGMASAVNERGAIAFDYGDVNVSKYRPAGCSGMQAIVDARLGKAMGTDFRQRSVQDVPFWFCSWAQFIEGLPEGKLREGLDQVKDYLG